MGQLHYVCPCCGYEGLASPPYAEMRDATAAATARFDPPYARFFGMPSYEVCDCCGYEFGNDDEPGTGEPIAFADYRKEWMQRGCPWFAPENKPPDWNVADQLKNIGLQPNATA